MLRKKIFVKYTTVKIESDESNNVHGELKRFSANNECDTLSDAIKLALEQARLYMSR